MWSTSILTNLANWYFVATNSSFFPLGKNKQPYQQPYLVLQTAHTLFKDFLFTPSKLLQLQLLFSPPPQELKITTNENCSKRYYISNRRTHPVSIISVLTLLTMTLTKFYDSQSVWLLLPLSTVLSNQIFTFVTIPSYDVWRWPSGWPSSLADLFDFLMASRHAISRGVGFPSRCQ